MVQNAGARRIRLGPGEERDAAARGNNVAQRVKINGVAGDDLRQHEERLRIGIALQREQVVEDLPQPGCTGVWKPVPEERLGALAGIELDPERGGHEGCQRATVPAFGETADLIEKVRQGCVVAA